MSSLETDFIFDQLVAEIVTFLLGKDPELVHDVEIID